MRYVTVMGLLYRLSKTAYKKVITHISKGEDCDIDSLGKCLGYVQNITDLTRDQAEELLEDYHRVSDKESLRVR